MKITKEEFIKKYCEINKVTPEYIERRGQIVVECNCGYIGCEGWVYTRKELKEEELF